MKKLLSLFLALHSMFMVSACGKNETENKGTQNLECYRISVVDMQGQPVEYALVQLYTIENEKKDTCYQVEQADKIGVVDYYVPAPDRYAILVYDHEANELETNGSYYTNAEYEEITVVVR